MLMYYNEKNRRRIRIDPELVLRFLIPLANGSTVLRRAERIRLR